jgi:hypothetical protein
MLCEEAREQILAGRSIWLGLYGLERDACVGVTDYHVEECPNCARLVVDEMWKRFRRRPGPLAYIRARHQARKVLERAQIDGMVDERPVTRVANTFVQEAIKAGATELVLEPIPAGTDVEQDAPGKPSSATHLAEARDEVLEGLRQDAAHYGSLASEEIREQGGLQARMIADGKAVILKTMPHYLRAPMFARYKDMANLRVCAEGIAQEGRIPIRYDHEDYDLQVRVTPHELGESIHIRIVAQPADLTSHEVASA